MPLKAPITRVLAGKRDLLLLAALRPDRYPGLLESVAHGTESARHDVIVAFPQRSLRLAADGRVRDDNGSDLGPRFLDALDEAWQACREDSDSRVDGLPFRGGWFLYLGYELAAEIEPRLDL
ncbi:MAG: aminodeoxychorismate synthase, component I, partial [Dokdonella sp.]